MTTRKIVLFTMADVSATRMRVWAQTRGFDLSRTYGDREIDPAEFDWHTTVIASEVPVDLPTLDVAVPAFPVRAVAFDVLGEGKRVPVLRIVSDGALAATRAFYTDVFGVVPTFTSFKPHVSLSYAWTGSPDLAQLEPPDFPLLFDRLSVRDLD